MSWDKMKSWLLKLGLIGFLFFFVKGLLWIAVLWFGVIFSVSIAQNERLDAKSPTGFSVRHLVCLREE